MQNERGCNYGHLRDNKHRIKYPFWHMTAKNPKAVYACINLGDACAPDDIAARSICIGGDIGTVLEGLR